MMCCKEWICNCFSSKNESVLNCFSSNLSQQQCFKIVSLIQHLLICGDRYVYVRLTLVWLADLFIHAHTEIELAPETAFSIASTCNQFFDRKGLFLAEANPNPS